MLEHTPPTPIQNVYSGKWWSKEGLTLGNNDLEDPCLRHLDMSPFDSVDFDGTIEFNIETSDYKLVSFKFLSEPDRWLPLLEPYSFNHTRPEPDTLYFVTEPVSSEKTHAYVQTLLV